MTSTWDLLKSTALEALRERTHQRAVLRALLQQALRLKTWRANLMLAVHADLTAVWFVGVFIVLSLLLSRLPIAWAAGIPPEWVTPLIDNRPQAMLIFFAVAAFGALTGGGELALMILLPLAIPQGLISINGALALVWGERVGRMAILAWQGRGQVLSVRRILQINLGASILASVVSFLVLGFARDFFDLDWRGLGYAWAFLSFYTITWIPFVAFAAMAGHFGQKLPEDMMESAAVPRAWLRKFASRRKAGADLLTQVQARLAGLTHLDQLDENERKKVPPMIARTYLQEKAALEAVVKELVGEDSKPR